MYNRYLKCVNVYILLFKIMTCSKCVCLLHGLCWFLSFGGVLLQSITKATISKSLELLQAHSNQNPKTCSISSRYIFISIKAGKFNGKGEILIRQAR